ncbi:MAG: prephenate dehydratase domain-containing protein [Chitinophagales bacterium]
MKPKIAIQGFEASFHEIVALNFFGKDIKTVECAFTKLFDVMKKDGADYVCAIENTLCLLYYLITLIPKFTLHIIGEVYLRIEMNLMAR